MGLKSKARDHLINEGVGGEPNFEVFLEMRYVGQAFEISVKLDTTDEAITIDEIGRAFSAEHNKIFEFSKRMDALSEIVSFRVGARIAAQAVEPPNDTTNGEEQADQLEQIVELREKEQIVLCKVLRSSWLGAEARNGPLLIEDGTTTILVPSNWSARRTQSQHIVLELRTV